MNMHTLRWTGLLWLTSLSLACQDGSGPQDSEQSDIGHDAHSGIVHYSESCGEPGETYTAGMSHTGDLGAIEFVLVSSDPAPPDKGVNVFTIQVTDLSTGVAIDGATVPITPFMPEHGHGTNPENYETEPTGEAGSYQSVPIDLFMSGLWDLTFTVQSGDTVLDQTTFSFCLEG